MENVGTSIKEKKKSAFDDIVADTLTVSLPYSDSAGEALIPVKFPTIRFVWAGRRTGGSWAD